MKRILILISVFIVIISFSSCGENENSADENTVYATVNGENIMRDEIEYFETRNRSEVINEFAEKYNITDFADFWNKDFDGTTPKQVLENKSFDDAVKVKIKLVLMRQYGIYDSIEFDYLKSLAEKYNEEHNGNTKSVGINSIDLTSFYTYYTDTGEMELKNKLAEGELAPSDAEIEDYMKNHTDVTEDGAKSFIVNEKYEIYIESLIEKAEIVKK